MRIAETFFRVIAVGAALAAAPALAFDGSKSDATVAAAPPITAGQAFRSGAHWLKAGETAKR